MHTCMCICLCLVRVYVYKCMCVYMHEKFLECVLVCAGLSISCVSMVCMFVCVCVHAYTMRPYQPL